MPTRQPLQSDRLFRSRRRVVWLLLAALLGSFLISSCSKSPQATKAERGVEGTWQGTVTISGQHLDIVVHFKANGTGTIDIPSQQAYGLPLEGISIASGAVNFDLKAGSDVATFRGKRDGQTITGRFEQAGHKGSFTLSKPQSAQPSLTDSSGDISVVLRTPGGDIHGSLALPTGKGPFPVVLIIAGSGGMNRNGNLPSAHVDNNSLLMLAEALKKHGIATVRYDKRGVGASAGALSPHQPLVFSELVTDAEQWVENLKKDKRFTKVGVIGYDQGSLVGMVAAEKSKAAVFVSVAGWADPADVRLQKEFASQPRSIRVDAESVIAKLKAGQRVANISNNLRSVLGPQRQPFLISEFSYDPLKEIARMTMPVLIVQGTNDLEVSSQQAEQLHKALSGSYLDLISGMNHVLKQAPSNPQENFATYSNPDLPLDPELVQDLTAFLQSVMVPVTATTGQSSAGGK